MEFKWVITQHIWYLSAGLVYLLVLFAVRYFAGLGLLVCIPVIVVLTAGVFIPESFQMPP
jgi:hypothetical protein